MTIAIDFGNLKIEYMIICVDFDGTICEHKYPEIGQEIEGAFETIKKIKEAGHQIILWTLRTNLPDRAYLTEAVEFCKEHGVEFDAVNDNLEKVKKVGVDLIQEKSMLKFILMTELLIYLQDGIK